MNWWMLLIGCVGIGIGVLAAFVWFAWYFSKMNW